MIGPSSVLLHGILGPGVQLASFGFQYGPTIAYGSTAPGGWILPALTPTSVSARVADLKAGVVYHFRLTATNADGTAVGADQTFQLDRKRPVIGFLRAMPGIFRATKGTTFQFKLSEAAAVTFKIRPRSTGSPAPREVHPALQVPARTAMHPVPGTRREPHRRRPVRREPGCLQREAPQQAARGGRLPAPCRRARRRREREQDRDRRVPGRALSPAPYHPGVAAPIRIGTCSWADESLTRYFYPREVKGAEERLRYYADRFDTVEANSTYYSLPAEADGRGAGTSGRPRGS